MHIVISIIIPAYNAERFIARCFKSIYKAVLSKGLFEVIVVNDGSSDNTMVLLREYCTMYSNLIVIDQQNGGVSVARNKGIEVAKGNYVLFLDADDELIDGALDKVCDYLSRHDSIDMLVTRQLRRQGENEWLVRVPSLEEYRCYNGVEAYKNGYVRTNAGGGICRTDFLREHKLRFPKGVRNAEDTIFFGQVQAYANIIMYYNLPLYIINEEVGSASRNADNTKLGRNHIDTMHSVASVKKSLTANREQRGLFDYVVYQLLSNTISYFVASKELSYQEFRREVDIQSLLPLDVKNMYLMKGSARVMNFSCTFFYTLSWLKHRIEQLHEGQSIIRVKKRSNTSND